MCVCILTHMFDPHYSQILYWGIQIFAPKIENESWTKVLEAEKGTWMKSKVETCFLRIEGGVIITIFHNHMCFWGQ